MTVSENNPLKLILQLFVNKRMQYIFFQYLPCGNFYLLPLMLEFKSFSQDIERVVNFPLLHA